MNDLPTIPLLLRALQIHLVFASLAAVAAWAATSSRRMSATAKYWIWVATSINFLLPVGVVLDRVRPPNVSWVLPLEDFGNVAARHTSLGAAIASAWAVGTALMLVRLGVRIHASRVVDEATPAVLGVFRPRISLPAGIERLLTPTELDAVLLHESTHARRRDNLIRLVHELGACVFWFHPLVWLAGSRLSFYRELSCDEAVIRGARGRELVSALMKLANPGETLLLQAGASSYLADRVSRLATPRSTSPAAGALRAVGFALVLVACVLASAFQANLMHRAAKGEFCSRGPAELAGRPGAR
jgi:beta-lactamase regulating signal transducer with metallopeptidase domain